MKKKLSIKQKQVLECVEWFINENGYSPTYREIAKLLNSDIRPVFEKIMVLEEKGYIKTKNGKSRTILIVKGVDDEC